MEVSHFTRLRPVLFHLTARTNLDHICADQRLLPAVELLDRAGRTPDARIKRKDHLHVACNGTAIAIRDQKPLHRGHIDLQGGWTFEDLLHELNSRVFFWPGNDAAPIGSGLRHFGRYISEDCVVLVMPTQQLFDANPDLPPQFCRFNSGSPRWTNGVAAPRGPDTFLPAERFAEPPGKVVETVFRGIVQLPMASISVRPVTDWR